MFSKSYVCEASFSFDASTQTYHSILNADADIRIQLSYVKPEIMKIYKNVGQYHSFYYFCFGKYSYMS